MGLSALVAAGMMAALAPWSLRNFHAYGSLSPLPHNGGIVLHQIYNAQNPLSSIWIPPFVNYSHPSEIWRGYAAEAQRIAGRDLTPPEVDAYWKSQAVDFIRGHPGAFLEAVGRKALIFLAATEVPNNRSSIEERLFSPVLDLLPAPMSWLLAMGLAGTVWLAAQDRRWPVIAAPIAIAWLTVALFWAEDRFRFHAAPVLALMSGFWVDGLARAMRSHRAGYAPAAGLLAVVVAAVSLYLGAKFPPPLVRWDHIVWGYIKMGKVEDARTLAERIAREQPDNGPIAEALGYIAAAGGRYEDAARELARAVELRPRSYLAHYNLAKAYLALGRKPEAAAQARSAEALNSSAEIAALRAQIEAAP
jgi:tetratricopeptide (TPR) repeat protein